MFDACLSTVIGSSAARVWLRGDPSAGIPQEIAWRKFLFSP